MKRGRYETTIIAFERASVEGGERDPQFKSRGGE